MCVPADVVGGAASMVDDLVFGLRALGHRVEIARLSAETIVVEGASGGSRRLAAPRRPPVLRQAAVLADYASHVGASVLHSHLSTALTVAVAGWLAGVPSVRTIHGRLNRPGMVTWAERSSVVAATRLLKQRLVGVSGAVATDLEQHYGLRRGKSVFVVPNGCRIDAARSVRRDYSGPLEVAFVGRFEEPKGFGELMLAFEALLDAAPEARLLLVGNGPLANAIDGRLVDSGAIRISSGWIGRDAARSLIGGCHAFVLPSHTEGISIALLEAMADGLVPIVSDAANGDGIVEDGVNGFVFATGSTSGLVRCLERLPSGRGDLPRLALAAQATVRERFEAREMARQYAELYARLAPARSGRGGAE